MHKPNFDFSFSGIKTAMLYHVKAQAGPIEGDQLKDLAASFQQAVVDVLCQKTLRAAREFDLERIVVAGGVACNKGLRRQMAAEAGKQGWK
ncbi:MAG: hypothetical protein R2864_06460 [Syntrophotaleaceae bacterium]